MSVLRLVALSLLVSVSALAAGGSRMSFSDASATITILPDLAPPKVPARTKIVLARLKDRLTAEMRNHFDLFVYVSKSVSGPLAQRMYVFRKQPDGLKPAFEGAAST